MEANDQAMVAQEMQVSNASDAISKEGNVSFLSEMPTSCYVVLLPLPLTSVFSSAVISVAAFNRFQWLEPLIHLLSDRQKALKYFLNKKICVCDIQVLVWRRHTPPPSLVLDKEEQT